MKETLEEAAERYSLELLEAKTIEPHEKTWIKSIFIHIAKYQAERMYSEEEVMDLFRKYQYDLSQWVLRMEDDINGKPIPTEWFKQFKNK